MTLRTFGLDTNVIIAAVCSWHEDHARAAAEIESLLAGQETMVIPAPALAEAYAVLTRLPAPHRLSPADAWRLLDANFTSSAAVVALTADAYVNVLRTLADRGIAGGRTYDAVIGECARVGRVDALLTFNRRHFEPAPDGVAIVEPRAV